MRGQIRGAGINLVALRVIDLHGVAAAVRDLLLLLLGGQRAVEYLLAVENRERRLDVILEPFVVVVANDDQRIGVGLRQAFAQNVELALTARVPLLADVERVLRLEMLALAKFVELREVVGSRAESQGLVLAIDIGAQVPLVRRRRQKRPMRRAKSENNFSHRSISKSLSNPPPTRDTVGLARRRTVPDNSAKGENG